VRNQFADTFYELGVQDPRLVVVVADISPAGSIARFRSEFPSRFLNTGVSEQIMIGMAAGLAQRGFKPFAYTIATFTLYRPFEMVRDDLCYQELPVTIVGIGGGVSYSTLGATHHAQEDISIACALPNMSVIAPCDPAETEAATRWCADQEVGPVYLRLGKAGEPDLTSHLASTWTFGRVREIRPGSDVCILTYGPVTSMGMELAQLFADEKQSASVVAVSTIKPLDKEGLQDVFSRFDRVLVLEEASPMGGLAMQVKALAWETGASCRIDAFTLKDAFLHCYGSHADIRAAHGLSVDQIARSIGIGSNQAP